MTNQWLNYHHLYYFMTIVEAGSISKAAQHLRIGQPTLSAQLKLFEETLAIKLFERQHKRLILTEQGKIAFDYAQNIFKLGNEMLEVLDDRIVPSRIQLKLGALDSIPKHVMLALTQSAYKAVPCNISLIEANDQELLRDVSTHRVDLAITNFSPLNESTQKLNHRLIARYPVHIYGSPEFKNIKGKFPNSLKGQKIILPTYDSQLRFSIEHWLKSNQISMDIIAETQDTSLTKLMATHGMALIASTQHSVADHIKNKKLIQIGTLNDIYENLYLVWADRKIKNPVAEVLIKNFHLPKC